MVVSLQPLIPPQEGVHFMNFGEDINIHTIGCIFVFVLSNVMCFQYAKLSLGFKKSFMFLCAVLCFWHCCNVILCPRIKDTWCRVAPTKLSLVQNPQPTQRCKRNSVRVRQPTDVCIIVISDYCLKPLVFEGDLLHSGS
jgi:hypothetical protein